MIIVKISGGLGNQLFQYSFGRYLSGKFNTELKFDIQTNYTSSDFTSRSVGLGNFNINLNLATKKEIYEFKYFDNEFIARIERKLVQKLPFLNRRYVVQNLNKSQKNDQNYKNDCYYDGYWQSENYFKPIASILKQEFISNFKPILDDTNSFFLQEIRNSESISIHIRRGDYISIESNKSRFSTCSLKYYEKVINYLKDKINLPLFFIFSEDIDWVKNNFKGEHFRMVTNNSKSPEIDLFLMSNCKHNIIANSSFSWWGAWLNCNKEKVIIAPEKWYNGKLNDSTMDLIPETWIRM